MTKLMIRFLGRFNSVRAAAYALLFIINIVHTAIHGTPLDYGMLDAMIAQANGMLLTVATQ